MAERRNRPERPRLDQPRGASRRPVFRFDAEAFGRVTEKIARFLGTGRFLLVQTAVILIWMIGNAVPGLPHPDEYPYLFLTLALSLQASYAAPLILLAQNRQDDRDRINLESDRDEARESKADLEYLARELAAIRMALGEVATRDYLRSELQRIEDRFDDVKVSKKGKKRVASDTPADAEESADSQP